MGSQASRARLQEAKSVLQGAHGQAMLVDLHAALVARQSHMVAQLQNIYHINWQTGQCKRAGVGLFAVACSGVVRSVLSIAHRGHEVPANLSCSHAAKFSDPDSQCNRQ